MADDYLLYDEEQGYDLNQLRKRKIGPFSDYAQVQDPDAYYKNVMKSDPTFTTHMGARDDYLPTSHPRAEEKTAPGYGYYPYTEESDPDFRPGDERQVWMNEASPAMKYYYPQKKGITSLDTSMYGGDQDIYGVENARGLFRPSQQSTDFNIKYGPEGITYYDKDEPQIFPKEKPILEDPNFQEGRKQHGETYGPLGPHPFKFPSIMEGLGAIRDVVKPMSPELKAQSRAFQDMGYVDPSQPQDFAAGPMEGYNIASAFGTNDPSQMIMDRINRIKNRKMAQTETSLARIAKLEEMKAASDRAAAGAQQAARDRAAGAFSSQVRQDPGGGGTWQRQTRAKERQGEQVAGPGFGKGAYFTQGGRVGYKTGGRVGILAAF